MLLYHFTSRFHSPLIIKDGYLKLTESNLIAPTKEEMQKYEQEMEQGKYVYNRDDLYKPVVWLTNIPDPKNQGLEGGCFNKSEIMFTLRKKEHYQKWIEWSRRNGIKKQWAEALERGRNPESWYISEKIIPLTRDNIIKIENVITGEIFIDVKAGLTTYICTVDRARGVMPIPVYDEFLGRKGLKKGDVVTLSL